MGRYRVYEGFRNVGGGVEGAQAGWDVVEAETAEEAAKEYWGNGWDDADENTVVVATDDDGDSYYYYPAV